MLVQVEMLLRTNGDLIRSKVRATNATRCDLSPSRPCATPHLPIGTSTPELESSRARSDAFPTGPVGTGRSRPSGSVSMTCSPGREVDPGGLAHRTTSGLPCLPSNTDDVRRLTLTVGFRRLVVGTPKCCFPRDPIARCGVVAGSVSRFRTNSRLSTDPDLAQPTRASSPRASYIPASNPR